MELLNLLCDPRWVVELFRPALYLWSLLVMAGNLASKPVLPLVLDALLLCDTMRKRSANNAFFGSITSQICEAAGVNNATKIFPKSTSREPSHIN